VLSVDDYRNLVLTGTVPLAPIELPLSDCDGCVLAEDVRAPWPLPSFDNSSMDGYAVRSADVAGAAESSPTRLRVVDDVPAGFRASVEVEPGTAIRIMTGAPIPGGADCVVPVEVTDGGTTDVLIKAPADLGACIRRAGEDVVVGDQVMSAGTLLTARHIALLAAVGRGALRVHPRPRVAVLSTGSELVEPGTELRMGLISDSNSFMLVAAARAAGAIAYRVPPVIDDEDAFLQAVTDQLHRADLILTSGGVSMGAYDTVKAVFSRLGTVDFMKVAMQPGMPQGYGRVGSDSIPVITLPGNPVSSYISFECFVRPVIRTMRGVQPILRVTSPCTLTTEMRSPLNKRQFARGRYVSGHSVEPVGSGQGSHVLGGLSQAECLIVIPEGVDFLAPGSVVDVIDLREDQ
jgi:molybdopterin molybdotransferase